MNTIKIDGANADKLITTIKDVKKRYPKQLDLVFSIAERLGITYKTVTAVSPCILNGLEIIKFNKGLTNGADAYDTIIIINDELKAELVEDSIKTDDIPNRLIDGIREWRLLLDDSVITLNSKTRAGDIINQIIK